jgi:DNA repair protein RecN (Recombination protein N)
MLEATESRVEELRRAVEEEWRRTLDLAKELSQRRRRAADRMQEGMEAELAALRMEQTTFRIQIRQTENREPTETGMDCVEYVLSANQGEPLLPLADVASGGELSRIMLALKTVLAQADGVPVLIFDEVDSGVDGAVAAVMGRRLRGLSKYHQVVCITHLPQIASQADTHFLVSKEVVKKRTVTRVGRLDRNGRRQELARMLAGLSVTKTALARAEEMIDEGAAH